MEGLVVTGAGLPEPAFWSGRRVLITGHTGFKGGWLAVWLHRLGAEVTGLALAPDTEPSLCEVVGMEDLLVHSLGDVRSRATVIETLRATQPEVVFHLAAQPLVSGGFAEPTETFSTNVMGTVNVLEAARSVNSVRSMVIVTSDKVYRASARPAEGGFDEEAPLGGADPYSASKAAAEMVVMGYRDAFLAERGVAVSTVRAGNVVGGGDWARDRLVPDAIRAWENGSPLTLRRPDAVRPWQHVLEPVAAYLRIAQKHLERPSLADAYNVGPIAAHSVRTVVELAQAAPGRWPVAPTVNAEPRPTDFAETDHLEIDVTRAATRLGIQPRWDIVKTMAHTMHWYAAHRDGAEAHTLCLADIDAFIGSSP